MRFYGESVLNTLCNYLKKRLHSLKLKRIIPKIMFFVVQDYKTHFGIQILLLSYPHFLLPSHSQNHNVHSVYYVERKVNQQIVFYAYLFGFL